MHPILSDAKAPFDVIYFAAKEGIENPRACTRIMYRDHNQFLSIVKKKKKKTQKQGKAGKRFRFLTVPYISVLALMYLVNVPLP